MKSQTKALILSVASVLGGFATIWFMSGCDQTIAHSQKPADSTLAAHNYEGEATINPHIGAPYPKEDVDAAYWKGVRDQAYSDYYGNPIYRTEEINGRVVLYKPIEVAPMTEVQVAAKVAVDNQAVLDSKEKKK